MKLVHAENARTSSEASKVMEKGIKGDFKYAGRRKRSLRYVKTTKKLKVDF